MNASFRSRLVGRATLTLSVATIAVSAASFITMGRLLDLDVDASLANVASIQAASITEPSEGEMRFHEWALTPEEAESVWEIARLTQVWDEQGRSLLRSQYMTGDLPVDPAALRAALAGETVWGNASYLGRPVRTLYFPLVRQGPEHERHVLQVAAPLEGRNQMLTQLAWILLAINLLVVLGTSLVALWLADRTLEPVHEIIDQAEVLNMDELGEGISAAAESAEYERLVQVLNSMLARIKSSFDAQRRFTADASHELRSPLTVMRGEIEFILRSDATPAAYKETLESVLEETLRLSRITKDLLTLARGDAGQTVVQPDHVDLRAFGRGLLQRLEGPAGESQVTLKFIGEPGVGWMDEGLLGEVLWNLVDNAIRYTPTGGEVAIALALTNQDIILDVTDEGPGLGENPQALFQRFARGDQARTWDGTGDHTGLGLSICSVLVEVMGGTITAENRPGGGAIFRVVVPNLVPNSEPKGLLSGRKTLTDLK